MTDLYPIPTPIVLLSPLDLGVSAPVLSLAAEVLTWTWDRTDPDSWSLESYVAGEWVFAGLVTGDLRTAAPAPDETYRIIGVDACGNPVTGYSNTANI